MSKTIQAWMHGRTAIGLAVLLSLAACGGGGGGGDSAAAPSTVTVAGVASKGLLAKAIVSAYGVNADGSKGVRIKFTTTDVRGNYVLAGLTPGALVLLEVTPNPDGTTTMQDEATGQPVPLPASSDFKLRAATSLEASGTTPAQITPYSEMAVNLAQQNGGIKPDVVVAANNKISAFAGVSILAEKPTFDEATGKATNAAAVKLAAVSELAKVGVTDSSTAGGPTTCSPLSGTPAPAEILARVSCVVNYLATAGTSSTATTALSGALETAKAKAEVSDPVEQAKVTVPLTELPTTLTVLPSAQQTAIQEAKTLIQSVRDTGAALSTKTGTDSLASRLQAMATSSYGVASPMDDSTLTLISAISEAIGKASSESAGFSLVSAPGDFRYFSPGAWSAGLDSGCTFFTDGTLAVAASGATDFLGCRVLHKVIGEWQLVTVSSGSVSYTYPTLVPKYAVQYRVRLTKLSADSYKIRTTLVKVSIGAAGLGTPTTLAGGSTLDPHEATVTRTGTAPNYTGFTLTGEIAPGVDYPWSYTPGTPFYTQEAVAVGTNRGVNVSLASVAVSSDTTRLNMQGDIRVYDGTTVQSRLSMLEGSYLQAKTAVGGDVSAPSAIDLSAHKMHLIVEGQLKDGYKVGGTLDLSDFVHTDNRWGPTKGSFAGYFTDMTGSTKLFDGLLTLTMPTDSGLSWTSSLTGTLVTTGTNTLSIELNVTASTTVLEDYTIAGRYTQGSNGFLMTVNTSGAHPETNALSFQTLSGVGFNYRRSDTVVNITKGETTVGQFNVGNSRLTFADNTYQQF